MLVIPPFDSDGNLPCGIHVSAWAEFVARFSWNPWRQRLVRGLQRALVALRDAGCARAYVDGSFVTEKDCPADFDGCWEIGGVDPSKLDPVLLRFDPGRLAQKVKFYGELFPAEFVADGGTGQLYIDFFQQDRNGKPKGLIALDLGSLP